MLLNLAPLEGKKPTHYRHVILHQFGKALGLQDAPPLYDEEKLKEYVKKQLEREGEPHSEEHVASRIKTQWAEAANPRRGTYDNDSVMHIL